LLALTKRNCEKCGRVFTVTEDKLKYPHSIDAILCGSCLRKWLEFFADHNTFFVAKYPKKINPTWEVFKGKIADYTREKVVFT